MTDVEKLVIGLAVTTLVGLIVWLVQTNFNDLKKTLAEIQASIVTKEICEERRARLDKRLDSHSEYIRVLFKANDRDAYYGDNGGGD
jgi:GTP-sensing pleiotropic transcriptional regulator CodY